MISNQKETKDCRTTEQKPGWPEWWATIPQGERRLIGAIAQMLRSAKRSQVREVAEAARKWERGIGFFVKVRLMRARPRRRMGT